MYLPGRFLDAWDVPFERLLSEANAAKIEITHEASRAAALKTAPYRAAREFRLPLRLHYHRFLGHRA